MPRRQFKTDEERFEHVLLRIATGRFQDTPSQAQVRLCALMEWAKRKNLITRAS